MCPPADSTVLVVDELIPYKEFLRAVPPMADATPESRLVVVSHIDHGVSHHVHLQQTCLSMSSKV
jgi:hypothetical protein